MAAFEFPELDDHAEAWDMLSQSGVAKAVVKDFYGQHIEPLPADWVHYAIKLFDAHQKKYVQFPFEDRRYLRQIYNCGKQRILLNFSRQAEKSTFLSNLAFTYCCLYPSFRALYVAPTDKHVTRFSKDRLSDTIAVSPRLNKFTNKALASNITEKGFTNMSRLILRSCYLKPDSVRGIPADLLMIDEIASIVREHIPVMEECLAHSPYHFRIFAGTPTTIDSAAGYYWMRSSQNEWAVPCYRHIPTHWNILTEKNIGPHCLVCDKCGEPINPWDEKAEWVAMYEDADWEGFRVPQTMVPSVEWSEIIHKQKNYSTQKFKNEVMAEFADEGTRPVTQKDLYDCCDPRIEMSEDKYIAYTSKLAGSHAVFMGLDYGTGDRSYTLLTLGAYFGTDMFKIFYLKRFEGPEADPVRQIALIEALAQRYNVNTIGADFGFGFVQNEQLKQHFEGEKYLMEFYYASNPKKKFAFSKGTNRFILHRSQMLSNLFNIIKMRKIAFPRWSDFEKPFAQDILNVSAVYNTSLRMITYEHPEDLPDDTLHSILYCFLASFREFPRQDLIGQRSIPIV